MCTYMYICWTLRTTATHHAISNATAIDSTGCCFPASMSQTDRLLLIMVANPVDPLLYFSCSIVRKPGGVQVLRSANREEPFLGLATRSAPYTTSFPIHLRVLYWTDLFAFDSVKYKRCEGPAVRCPPCPPSPRNVAPTSLSNVRISDAWVPELERKLTFRASPQIDIHRHARMCTHTSGE